MSATVQQRDQLEIRLHDGWGRIAEAEAAGREIRAWETFWMSLLAEYEGVCRELDALSAISLQVTPAATPSGIGSPMGAEHQASLMSGGGGGQWR